LRPTRPPRPPGSFSSVPEVTRRRFRYPLSGCTARGNDVSGRGAPTAPIVALLRDRARVHGRGRDRGHPRGDRILRPRRRARTVRVLGRVPPPVPAALGRLLRPPGAVLDPSISRVRDGVPASRPRRDDRASSLRAGGDHAGAVRTDRVEPRPGSLAP